MSNFIRTTKNPATGEFEDATWIDHGVVGYSVDFPSGNHYRADAIECWEFQDEKSGPKRGRPMTAPPAPPERHDTGDWKQWFAWYPIMIYGYAVGPKWFARRWVWMRRVEWTERHPLGYCIYRLPEDSDL